MILYLDTSALVKVYVTELFREPVVSAMQEAEAVASHTIAYVEAHAAFARALNEGKLTEGQHEAVKREFRADWESYLQVGTSQSLIQRAAGSRRSLCTCAPMTVCTWRPPMFCTPKAEKPSFSPVLTVSSTAPRLCWGCPR